MLKWEEHPCLSEFIMRGIRWNQSVILQCSFFNKEITNLSSKCSEKKKQLVLTVIITSWKSWGAVTYMFSKVIFSKSDLNSSSSCVCDWSAGENGWFFFFFPGEYIFLFSCQIKFTQRNIFPVWEADWDLLTWKKKTILFTRFTKTKKKYSAGRIFPGRNFW